MTAPRAFSAYDAALLDGGGRLVSMQSIPCLGDPAEARRLMRAWAEPEPAPVFPARSPDDQAMAWPRLKRRRDGALEAARGPRPLDGPDDRAVLLSWRARQEEILVRLLAICPALFGKGGGA